MHQTSNNVLILNKINDIFLLAITIGAGPPVPPSPLPLPHLLDVAEADAGPPLLHPRPHPGVQLDAPLLDVVAHAHTRSRAEVTHPGHGAAAW